MLTPRDNYLALVSGGTPERLVNQYEPFAFIAADPLRAMHPRIPGQDVEDGWGTVMRWKAGDIAAIPYITEDNKACPDVTQWERYVKAPSLDLPASAWQAGRAEVANINRKEKLVATIAVTGLFERLHFLMGFEDALLNLLLEPESMHALLDYITNWRLDYFRLLIDHFDLDAILSHDDWGAKDRLFMSPGVWREFFKPRYAILYGYLKRRGVRIIHHADSYLMPIAVDLAELGIETWQGVLPSNDIPTLQRELGGSMLLMGGIDAGAIDRADWTEPRVRAEVQRACSLYAAGGGFIPCLTYGGPGSIYPGVFDTITDEINNLNRHGG